MQIMFDLLDLTVDSEEYFQITIDEEKLIKSGGDKIDTMDEISTDFGRPLEIRPVSDPNIISKQEKTAKAQFIYNTVLTNPLTQSNPDSIFFSTLNLFQSLDVDDFLIQAILPRPEPQQPPDLPQEEENKRFINEESVQALETQGHEQHLAIIKEFEESPFFEEMGPKGKQELDRHKKQHVGFLYLKTVGVQRAEERQMIEGARSV